MYFGRWHVGTLFGSSDTVNSEIAKIIPIFLASVPFFWHLQEFPLLDFMQQKKQHCPMF